MINLSNLLLSSVLATSSLCVAQEPGTSPNRQNPSPSAKVKAAPAGAQHWVKQLGSDSYRERLEAENKLREMGKAAVPALEAASKQIDDGEVQWRAKRLLRQIDRGTGPAPVQGGQEPGGLVERSRTDDREPRTDDEPMPRIGQPRNVEDMQGELDRLFGRLEREFGLDMSGRTDVFRDLHKQLQQQLERGGKSMGHRVQVGPGQVHVEIEEVGEDGKVERKVYDAPDMKTFKERYPGVLEKGGARIGLQPLELDFDIGGTRGLRGLFGPRERDADGWPKPLELRLPNRREVVSASPPPAGQRLGIVVRDIPDGVREYLDLGDRGLMVQSVQPDTLASKLGLTKNDIVTRIGKHEIASAADVRKALGGIDKGATVVVEYIRKGRRQTAETKKLAAGTVERAPIEKVAPRGKKPARIR